MRSKYRVRKRSLRIPPHLQRASGGAINRTLGDEAQLVGQSRELVALHALQQNPEKLPSWLISARKGTKEEDRSGIDIQVETDAGIIPIQIKGTSAAAAEFHWDHPKIAVYIVRNKNIDKVRVGLLALISKERDRLLSDL